MESPLQTAARELRTRLAGQTALSPALMFAAPGLRQALPIIVQLLDQISILDARVRVLEGGDRVPRAQAI